MEPIKVEQANVKVMNMGYAVVTQSRAEIVDARDADYDLYMERHSSPVEPVFYWASQPVNQGDRVAATVVDFVNVNDEGADMLRCSIHTAAFR